MDETADARRILTGVHQSDWSRPVGRPYTSWIATLKSDLSLHNLTFEDAIELAMDKPLWRLLVASGATHWHGACRIMMMMMMMMMMMREIRCHIGDTWLSMLLNCRVQNWLLLYSTTAPAGLPQMIVVVPLHWVSNAVQTVLLYAPSFSWSLPSLTESLLIPACSGLILFQCH